MAFLDFLPVVGNLVSGLFNNDAADERQEDAQSFSAQQFATRYQTTMADMKAAGLNPGLAYGGISGNAPTSSAASSAGMPGLGDAYNDSVRARSQAALQSATQANIEADTANKAAQGKLYEAQAAAAYGSADQAHASVRLIGENVNKIMAEIPNIRDSNMNIREQKYVIQRTAEMLEQQASLMKQQGMSQSVIRDNLKAQIEKLASETALNNFSIEAAENMGNIGRELGQLGPIFDLIKAFILRR